MRVDSEISAFNSAFGSSLLVPDDCALRFDSAAFVDSDEGSEQVDDVQARQNVLLAGENSDFEDFNMGEGSDHELTKSIIVTADEKRGTFRKDAEFT